MIWSAFTFRYRVTSVIFFVSCAVGWRDGRVRRYTRFLLYCFYNFLIGVKVILVWGLRNNVLWVGFGCSLLSFGIYFYEVVFVATTVGRGEVG